MASVVLVALVGCGDGDTDSGTDAAPATTAAEADAGAVTSASEADTVPTSAPPESVAVPATTAVATEPMRLRVIASSTGISVMDHYVAIRGGLCEDEGLLVEELPTTPSSAQVATAVAAGDADVGVSGTGPIFAIDQQGQDVVFFAQSTNAPTNSVMISNKVLEDFGAQGITPESSALDRLAALKDVTIATQALGGGVESVLRGLFASAGIDKNDDTYIAIGDVAALAGALREGQIEAFSAGPPLSLVPAQEGFGVEWIQPGEMAEIGSVGRSLSGTAVTSRRFYDEHPEALEAYYRCISAAQEMIASDPARATEIYQDVVPETDPVLVAKGVEALASLFAGPAITEEAFLASRDLFNASAEVPTEATFDDLVISLE